MYWRLCSTALTVSLLAISFAPLAQAFDDYDDIFETSQNNNAPPKIAAMAAPISWSGLYLTAAIGGTLAKAKTTKANYDTHSFIDSYTPPSQKMLVHAFYLEKRFQPLPHVIAGVQGGIGWIHPPKLDNYEHRWSLTAQGTVGYALGNFLPYISFGTVFARQILLDAASDSSQKNRFGRTLGAGLDIALSQHIISRTAYKYQDFGTTATLSNKTAFISSYKAHVLETGLSLHF